MGTRNDVRGNQAIADSLTGISACAYSCVHRTGFTAHHDGHVATAHILPTDQLHLGSFGHRIGRFDCRHHPTSFDHAEGNA